MYQHIYVHYRGTAVCTLHGYSSVYVAGYTSVYVTWGTVVCTLQGTVVCTLKVHMFVNTCLPGSYSKKTLQPYSG